MRLFFCIVLLLQGIVYAQPQRELLLTKIPYVPEPSETPSEPLLNTAYALRQLDPLPNLQLPAELPIEFHPEAETREANQLYLDAVLHLRQGDSQKSVAFMEKAIALKPDLLLLQIMYADSLLSAARFDDARKVYESILETHPSHYQCLNNLAWILATRKGSEAYDPERARSLAERARLVNPNSHHVWSTLSEAQYQLGQYEEATQSLNIAMDLANRTGAPPSSIASYLLKRDLFQLTREATSLLE